MRRRKWKLLAAALLFAGIGAFVLLPRSQPQLRVTRQNFDRIETGMSREEVYTLLGPPGLYVTGPVAYSHPEAEQRLDAKGSGALTGEYPDGIPEPWFSNEGLLAIWFDPESKRPIYKAWSSGKMQEEKTLRQKLAWSFWRLWRGL
jgi:hypothetical protein